MAITNYTTLQAAVNTWLARADLTAVIPDFIAMAEADMDTRLRCRHNEASASDTIASGALAVPSRYVAMRACYIDKAEQVYLEPKPLYWIYQEYPSSHLSEPRFFARRGADFIFGPYPDSNYTVQMYYYKQLDIATDTTNEVLTNYRNIYLYGALYHASAYTRDSEQETKWGGKFADSIERVNSEEKASVVSGGAIAASRG